MKRHINKSILHNNVCINIGSRPSPLALIQVDEIVTLLKRKQIAFSYKLKTFPTAGDQDKKTPLTQSIKDDFFTNTLDQALLNKTIDVAIHSAKDLPRQLHSNLIIAALTSCMDHTDAFIGNVSFDQLPRNARIGTSSFLREESLKSLRPDVTIVHIRGTIQERIQQIQQGSLDGIIVATCALKRLHQDHLIKNIFPWEGTPLQGQLAVVCRKDDANMAAMFKTIDVRHTYGCVHLIGAGPGDPSLITLKAIMALKEADCVFYDYLVDPALLKYAAKAEHIYAGKRKGSHSIKQDELCRQIRLKAMAGKNVVRLKGGDPLIFGRGFEELNNLRSYHIPVSVIPGVSSATGLPSLLGFPLTARDLSASVSFISAHSKDEIDRNSNTLITIPQTDTVVIFMGLTRLDLIVQSFDAQKWNLNTPTMIISQGSSRRQQIITGTLSTIQDLATKQAIKPPALIIVGKVVDLYQPQTPLKRYLFTGTHPQEYLGLGEIISWPMIHIKPKRILSKERTKILSELSEANLILLTSEYAVEYFQEFLQKEGVQLKSLTHKEFAVIGSYTAQALLNHGVWPKFVPSVETAQGLYAELKNRIKLKGLKIIFPRSSLPNPFLKEALIRSGAHVFDFGIYQNDKPKKRPLPKHSFDGIIFTSPSTVNNFLKDYHNIPEHWEILCKGPISQKELNKHGYQSRVMDQ